MGKKNNQITNLDSWIKVYGEKTGRNMSDHFHNKKDSSPYGTVLSTLSEYLISDLAQMVVSDRQEKVSKFKNFDDLLFHLANISPKEQAKFLKSWSIPHSKKSNRGRTKEHDALSEFFLASAFDIYRTAYEKNHGKKISEIQFMRVLFSSEKVDVADRHIKTLANRLAEARKTSFYLYGAKAVAELEAELAEAADAFWNIYKGGRDHLMSV